MTGAQSILWMAFQVLPDQTVCALESTVRIEDDLAVGMLTLMMSVKVKEDDLRAQAIGFIEQKRGKVKLIERQLGVKIAQAF